MIVSKELTLLFRKGTCAPSPQRGEMFIASMLFLESFFAPLGAKEGLHISLLWSEEHLGRVWFYKHFAPQERETSWRSLVVADKSAV